MLMYSSDPVADAMANEQSLAALQNRLEEAEEAAKIEFANACKAGDGSATPSFAQVKGRPSITLADALLEALDYQNGPKLEEAMQLLLDVANGKSGTQEQAAKLLERAGEYWVKFNMDEVLQ